MGDMHPIAQGIFTFFMGICMVICVLVLALLTLFGNDGEESNENN